MDSIFIGGCPRSGTTLLASYFGSLPNFVVTPESQFKEKLIYDNNFNESSLIDCNWLLKQHSFRIWLQNKEFASKFRSYSSSANTVSLDVLVGMYGSFDHQDLTWVDHTPSNILHIDKLNNFNLAKFIHIIRDGRAVSRSVVSLPWGPNDFYSSSYWWLKYISAGLSASFQNIYQIEAVKYEELTLSTEDTIKKILLSFNINIESLEVNPLYTVPDYSKAQHSLIGGEIVPPRDLLLDIEYVSRYKMFESVAFSTLVNLGYPLISEQISHTPFYIRYLIHLNSFVIKTYNIFRQLIRKFKVRCR